MDEKKIHIFYINKIKNLDYAECCCDNLKPLKRLPQSWCYVEVD